MKRIQMDTYEKLFSAGDDQLEQLKSEVTAMEEASTWHRDIAITKCDLQALDPMQCLAEGTAKAYRLDEEVLEDTVREGGTRLLFNGNGIPLLVRATAYQSLFQAAKLWGAALGRMSPYLLSETLNNAFSVGRGKVMLLERGDKLTACHSDGEGGYEIMPISELLDISVKALTDRFEEIEMSHGYNSHENTTATFLLVGKQQELMDRYQKILDTIGSKMHAADFIPAVRFRSSDTSAACATLEPVFIGQAGVEIKFAEGVAVKHSKVPGGKLRPMEEFEKQAYDLYAKFDEAYANLEKLAERQVYHAENFVISVCKKLRIPKKYGEVARQEAVDLAVGEPYLNGHDMYVAMMKVVEAAADAGASTRTLMDLDEKVSRVPSLDWAEHDVGGKVAWADV